MCPCRKDRVKGVSRSELQLLVQEISATDFINDAIQKNIQLGASIESTTTAFKRRLEKLETIVMPIFQETEALQRRKENLDQTIQALDHVLGYYNLSRDLDAVIRDRPLSIGLEKYVASLRKLENASEFFQKNSPECKELENVTSLYEVGTEALNSEFKEIVSRYSRPLPPAAVLDLICSEEEAVRVTPVQLMPEESKEHLVKISDWLINHQKDEFMNVYASYRAATVFKTIIMLRDHQRSLSAGAPSSLSGSPGTLGNLGSPALRPKFAGKYSDTPSKKTSKKISQLLEKKANQMLMKASQTLESSTGLAIGNKRSGLHEMKEDTLEENEILWIMTATAAFLRLLQAELAHMIGIVNFKHYKWVLSIIMKEALEQLVADGETLINRAKRSIARSEFASLLAVLPILKHSQSLRKEFDSLLEGCDSHVRTKFTAFVNLYYEVVLIGLGSFLEYIRSDSGAHLPKDGTVYEVTSNVLVFLEQLLDYVDTVGPLLAKDDSYKDAGRGAKTKEERNRALVGLYVSKVLAQLNYCLVTKSDTYSDSYLKAIFRLNNYHYVVKVLLRSGLLDLVKVTEPGCEAVYRDMINEQKKSYSQCWTRVLNPILPGEDVPVAVLQSGKLREKDRSLIKEKFSAFNKEFEDVVQAQRGYSVPDIELRESLKRDNKEEVLHKYETFYDRYSSVNFTKNVEKYIRFTPAHVSSQIDTFFDVTA